ncbi:carboxypeptidase regulatory-like domain-containing protein [Microbacterium sp. MM2322]|uniref:carboxypeptidase regulatory-like domain-containing protein n=1 Tax=Microbacterium sp. MM2322 TaxID=3157631 RepID=UPI0032D5AB58
MSARHRLLVRGSAVTAAWIIAMSGLLAAPQAATAASGVLTPTATLDTQNTSATLGGKVMDAKGAAVAGVGVTGATISGRVTDSNGKNLGGVMVEYARRIGSAVERIGNVKTSADGTYRFVGLMAGSYVVEFRPNETTNLIREWWRDAPNSSTAVAITLARGATVKNVDASLAAGGILSGRVTGPSGRALDGIRVTAVNTATGVSVQGGSDGTGAWSIRAVPPGTYRVDFAAPGDVNVNLVTEWWKNAPTAAAATTVTVSGRQRVANLDARLTSGGTIGGVVTGPSGARQADVQVFVYQAGRSIGHTYSKPDGSYLLQGLADGRYTLRFRPTDGGLAETWWKGQASSATAAPVTISGANDLRKMNATLPQGTRVTGTFRDSSGKAVSDGLVAAFRLVDGVWERVVDETADAAGKYTLSGLPAGTYTLEFTAWQEGRARAIWLGGKPSVNGAKRFTVGTPATLTGYNATAPRAVAAGSVTVSGTVRVGSTLTAVSRAWGRGASFAYQWYRDGEPIRGATRSTLALTPADFGTNIGVVVTGWSTGTSSVNVSQWMEDPVAAGRLVAPIPKVTGSAKVGSTLKAVPGTWTTGASLTYQWFAGGKPVSKATGSTYKIPSSLQGKKLTVTVTGKKSEYTTASATSAATTAVVR